MEEDCLENDVLYKEYEWILKEEVKNVLSEVEGLLNECCRRFPIHLSDVAAEDNLVKPEKYLMSTSNGSAQIKCVVTLMGDRLLEADLALRMNKHQTVPHKFCIYPDAPWFLQQIQDAANHLLNARATAQRFEPDHAFRDAKQVLHLLEEIMTSIKRGRTSLALPRKRTLEELVNNPTLEVFKPALPQDVALVFYIQAQKLVLALYQLYINEAQKIDISARHQIDCTVPWLNDTLVLFTLALQQCQALKDKIIVLEQYKQLDKYSTTKKSTVA